MQVALDSCPWSVRAYHRVWMRLPYVRQHLLGAGVYAVSKTGRARFSAFPDVIADDCFVRLQFSDDEKTIVDSHQFIMFPPRSLSSLIAINARRQAWHEEMRARFAETTTSQRRGQRGALLKLLKDPRLWPSIVLYTIVKFHTLRRYRRNQRAGKESTWLRDNSSRQVPNKG